MKSARQLAQEQTRATEEAPSQWRRLTRNWDAVGLWLALLVIDGAVWTGFVWVMIR